MSVGTASALDDSKTAQDQAKKILSDKKYSNPNGDTPFANDAKRLTQWLGEGKNEAEIKRKPDQDFEQQEGRNTENRTLPSIGASGSAFKWVAILILIPLVAAIIGCIIYLLVKRSRNPKKDKSDKTKKQKTESDIHWSDEQAVLEEINDADLLESLSDQAEANGHFDIALRYRFRAGLLRLSERHVITFHPSITNAQWQLTLNNATFDELTNDFNDVTYGEQVCDALKVNKAKSSWAVLALYQGPTND